jgi:hypothetical protein
MPERAGDGRRALVLRHSARAVAMKRSAGLMDYLALRSPRRYEQRGAPDAQSAEIGLMPACRLAARCFFFLAFLLLRFWAFLSEGISKINAQKSASKPGAPGIARYFCLGRPCKKAP